MKIDFEFTTPHGVYRDAIHLPDDHTLTDDEIADIKQQRLGNWIAVVTAPTEPEPLNTIEISGETYTRLEGVPPAGAKLVEVTGIWYYKE